MAARNADPGSGLQTCDDLKFPLDKAGIARCQPVKDVLEDIVKSSTINTHFKYMEKQMGKEKLSQGCCQLKHRESQLLIQSLRAHLPTTVPEIPVPSLLEPLKKVLCEPRPWTLACKHVHVHMTGFGCTEFRLLVSGTELIAGVKLGSIAGDTLTAKVSFLNTAKGAQLFAQCCADPSHGFCLMHDIPGTMVSLPQGYLILYAGGQNCSEGARGVRWYFLEATSKSHVTASIANMQFMKESCADLQQDYDSWEKCLNANILPVAT